MTALSGRGDEPTTPVETRRSAVDERRTRLVAEWTDDGLDVTFESPRCAVCGEPYDGREHDHEAVVGRGEEVT